MESESPSIRAASWSAARCVRHYCQAQSVYDSRIDAFCRHLEDAATAHSLGEWDALGNRLEVTGLGDPLPGDLEAVPGLNALLCAAREVTASQMYGAWTPHNVISHLRDAAVHAGLDADVVVARATNLQRADRDGWGSVISESERARWSRADDDPNV